MSVARTCGLRRVKKWQFFKHKDVGVINELYDTKEQAFEAGKMVGRLDLDDWAKKRIAELEAENAALKKQVEVLGRIAERQPSLAAKCFPNPYKLYEP